MRESPREPAIEPAAFTPLGDGVERAARRWRAPLLALAAVLAGFALGMWFLFTARSVLITVEPEQGTVDIDGGLHLRLGGRHLLRPGRVAVEIRAAGHHPLRRELVIGEAARQEFRFELAKLPGKVSFASEPQGATVLVDGEEVGATPLPAVDIAPGTREVSLLLQRYRAYRGELEVAGMGGEQRLEVALQPAWATVAIASAPAGASVFVDGEEVAATPAALELLEGDRQLELRLPRHRIWRQTLGVSAGADQDLGEVALRPAGAVLRLRSQPDRANVTLDGEYRGQTPLELEIGPGGRHRVAVFKPGHSSASRGFSLAPGERRDLLVRLEPQLGEVRVRVEPADAEILVGGRSQGRGSRTLALPAFEQTLEVRREGYRGHRQRFTPRSGLEQIIEVRLVSARQARLATLEPEYASAGGQSMRLLSGGDFTMGASRREPGRRANEILHPASLTRMFYLSQREVSNAEFRRFRPAHNSGRVEGNSLNRDRQPAVMLSWSDAALYCNWLSEREKLPPFYRVAGRQVTGFDADSRGYRLPSEAEWAWAARSAGERWLKFPWGSDYPPRQVAENYADQSSAHITGRSVSGYRDGHVVSAPTASFQANHHGLHDMGGNVAEWVHDVYELADGKGATAVDPLGPQTGHNHVIRGASWAHGTVTELRLSFRDYGQAGRDDVGFRIARYAVER